MSESSFPFQGQPVATAPAAPEFEPAPDKGNRTMLRAAGGVAVALVLGALAYFLVFAGGGDEVKEGSVAAPKPAAAVPAAPETSTVPAKGPRVSAKSFGRDPFKALIVEPVAAVAAPAATGTTPDVSTGTGTTTDPAPAAPVTSTPVSSSSHTFRVVTVAPDSSSVDVKVDGKLYRNQRAGEVFATYFKVVLISGQVNSFQFGEEKFNVIGTKRLTIA